LQRGYSPQQALDFMLRGDEGRDSRQVAILDLQGRSAAWTGKSAADWKGHRCTPDYCVEGNTLAGPQVLEGMVKYFEAAANQPLAERLLAALDGGQVAGWRSSRNASRCARDREASRRRGWLQRPRSRRSGR
jgi:uncharacterized Ntn-hydrolase superfamily protein